MFYFPSRMKAVYRMIFTRAVLALGLVCALNVTIAGADPAIIEPASGTVISTPSVKLTWSADAKAREYFVMAGSKLGGRDIYNKSAGLDTSVTISRFALNGTPLFIELWTNLDGTWKGVKVQYMR